ncbi:hypothetical protein CHGG_04089 [Chaetomium globosum CBS 148.51]|uniref:Tricarboxylate transport protein n=1 Tax=Chaetomium globosum (strain ATCC 6205 / CBS 148.51 / DSM 1962 / NBRC 6347 / NRRL 1970) TaxID=306901 RepID=Q2H2A7_CHAGB|nr:uncharacterized protein CHGG_04089 [Chaetomium globosum CBS 148.51]EAQ87470.1 hypothetical protein CHGG_04089 [Chaetomium globosum CBS 148.51]
MTTPRPAGQTQRTEAKKVSPLVSVVSGAVAGASEAAITGTALKAGVRFMSFDSIKNHLSDPSGHLTATQSLFAGMVAGALESVAAVTPTERIKTAMIDDARGAKRYRSSAHAAGILVKEQGITTLYKGLSSTTLKQCTTSAVRMGSYNMLKQMWQKSGMPQNSITTFALGAIAGTITVYATQPFDTIKSRTQSAKGATTLEAATIKPQLKGPCSRCAAKSGQKRRMLLPERAGQVPETNQGLAPEGQDGANVGWVTAGRGRRVSRSHGRGAEVRRGTNGLLCVQPHQGPKQVEAVPATGLYDDAKGEHFADCLHSGDARILIRLGLGARHAFRASTVCDVREHGGSGGGPMILIARVIMVPIPGTS